MSNQNEASIRDIASALVLYSTCSAGMLIVNKLTIKHIPFPATVTMSQFVFCVVALKAMAVVGWIKTEAVVWDKARHFVVYVVAFALSTYANMQVLAVTNVETVIVARSTLPIAVAGVDYLFRNYEAPNRHAWCAFTLIVGGAVGYAWNDLGADLLLSSYLWIALWWLLLVFQLSYGNALIRSVPFDSTWSPVLYNNLLSIPLSLLLVLGSGERVEIHDIKPRAWMWWVLSCVVGTLISFSGFWCQRVVSATCYTVLGVTNKILAVLLNQLMWKHHASGRGTMMLLVCLLGGAFYRPSSMRRNTLSAEEISQLREMVEEEEGQK